MTPERWQRIKPILSELLELPASQRAARLIDACGDDSALAAEVDALVAAHDRAGTFLNSPAADLRTATGEGGRDQAAAGRRIGAYEIVRELGRGGMGVVYLASRADHAFDREVAIKLARAPFGDAHLSARFRDERQILANLNHPCVARLLDGGTADDDTPYLVMEYVEGVPIDQFCTDRRLDTRQRLELFRQVCDAVHYAHRNLIIHRDIKPANILVTREGAPKLLDFGIAKLLGPNVHDPGATLRFFTPDYASPEQIRGEPMTTVSDVYGLGMLLYVLLTGRRAYAATTEDPLERARLVCEVEPAPPCTGARDLDTILLKALRKEPERRYGSVEQFSDDIGRFLDGLPVRAAPATVSYRTAKFVRRHAVAVAAAGALFLLLTGATAVTTWQAYVASRERTRAEHRFNEVRGLANLVVGDLHDAIKDLSGATAARKLLVTRAVEYLDRLASESAGDTALQRELAAAYVKMGDAQGNPFLANLGDGAGAMRSYRKAFELHSALAGASPSDVALQRDVAGDQSRLAEMYWADGHYAESLTRFQAATSIYESLASADPAGADDRFNLSRMAGRMGLVQISAGNLPAAMQLYRRSLELTTALMSVDPGNVAYRRGVAVAAVKIGDVADRQHDYSSAFEGYREGERITRQLAAENPASADLRRTFALSLGRLAMGHLKLRRPAEAVAANHETIDIYESLVTADPANVQTQIDMADTYTGLGEALSAAGNDRDGEAALQRALAIYARHPGYTAGAGNFATLYLTLGGVLIKRDARTAVDAYRRAAALFAVEPARSERPARLADSYAGMGAAQAMVAMTAPRPARAAAFADARHSYERSLAIWIELRDRDRLPADEAARPGEIASRIADCIGAERRALDRR